MSSLMINDIGDGKFKNRKIYNLTLLITIVGVVNHRFLNIG